MLTRIAVLVFFALLFFLLGVAFNAWLSRRKNANTKRTLLEIIQNIILFIGGVVLAVIILFFTFDYLIANYTFMDFIR